MEDDDEKKEAASPPLTDCAPLSIRLGMIEFARLIAAEEVTETSQSHPLLLILHWTRPPGALCVEPQG